MTLLRLQRPDVCGTSPFGRLSNLNEVLNRFFEEPFGPLAYASETFSGWTPSLDLREDKENLVAAVELPGLKKEDIEVSIHDGVLSVTGERKRQTQSETEGAYRTERFYGRFQRSIALPKPVRTDAVKAAYGDGVLTITLPKTEEAKPRQIEVGAA
jgi:HSP20 family protein